MSDKPTESDLIKLELRDLLASVGEVRMGWNAVMTRLAAMEERLRKVEANAPDTDRRALSSLPDWLRSYSDIGQWFCEHKGGFGPPFLPYCDICAERARALKHQETRTMTGSIQGLEGEFTVTPPPEFVDAEGNPLEVNTVYRLVEDEA